MNGLIVLALIVGVLGLVFVGNFDGGPCEPQFKPPKDPRYTITCRDFQRATVRWPCHRCGTLTTVVCDRCDLPVCPSCRGTHEPPSEAHPFGIDACLTCKETP